MVSASFQQLDFRGGEWSDTAQGRVTDPNYPRALAASLNGMPMETGAWTRRPGLRFLGLTRHGAPAKLFEFTLSTNEPYQIELTDGFLRMWAGLALVMADNASGYGILGVSTDTPAVVTTTGFPGTWANGDTAYFFINSTPCGSTALCNRQFTIGNLNATDGTFALYDPITGAAIDGSTLAYNPTMSPNPDTVAKVFELATPYTSGSWSKVRAAYTIASAGLSAANNSQATFFHPTIPPQTLVPAVAEPFALSVQAFTDGPYLDLNQTTTTLTPGGLSGSITMTASSTIGINNDNGFQATDVGRAIRFMSSQPDWAIGTSYAKAAQVTGADDNIYQAVLANVGVDPTTDDGTHWLILGLTVQWVWMLITAVADTTHVTATVQGVASQFQETATVIGNTLASVSAQTQWQLGFFSDTTGYPILGTYHDGRLCLANAIQENRLDLSVSDDYFNFCPTALDGTVSDDNAIAAVESSNELDAVYWLLSTGDGLIAGAQGGEWRLRASMLDDPITPTNLSARKVSRFGSDTATEAIIPWGRPVFIQRAKHKLIALRQATEIAYDGDNITREADQITAPGIEEIRWRQEPDLTMYMRRSDGTLAGCVYRSSAYNFQYSQATSINDVNFQGFFPVQHAYNRSFLSISSGPSYDGKSSALYAVTNQTDNTKPDYNVCHVEYLMPLFTPALADWAQFFVDGGASPCCSREFLVSNGDPFNGVRIYGLTYLNGLPASASIGGLDLGDHTVANGSIDLPFGTPAAFTQAFFEGLNNGTDYGAYGDTATFFTPSSGTLPPHPANNIGSYVNASETHGKFGAMDIDLGAGVVYGWNNTDGFLDAFNYGTFALNYQVALSSLLHGHSWGATAVAAGNDGYLYTAVDGTSHSPFLKVNPTNPSDYTVHGTSSSSGAASGSQSADGYAMRIPLGGLLPITVNGHHFLQFTCNATLSSANEISIFDGDTMCFGQGSVFYTDEPYAATCLGPVNYGTDNAGIPQYEANFFIVGYKGTFSSGDTIGLYRCAFAVEGAVNVAAGLETWTGAYFPIGKIAPVTVDATWTTFNTVSHPIYCATDNTIVFGVSCTDSVAHTSYLLKVSAIGEIVWKIADAPVPPTNLQYQTARKTPYGATYAYFGPGTNAPLNVINLKNGTLTTTAFQTTLLDLGQDFFDEADGGIVLVDPEWSWGTNPTFLGAWSIANGAAGATGYLSKLYLGLDGRGLSVTRNYAFPGSFGLTYTSQGMLLPPNYGQDAGTRNGPAFGKVRRIQEYAVKLVRTQGISFGSDNFNANTMKPAPLQINRNGAGVQPPALFSDTIATSVDNDYSFGAQLSWEITRPYPATIAIISGYIESVDK
jgi:hypothetical protein